MKGKSFDVPPLYFYRLKYLSNFMATSAWVQFEAIEYRFIYFAPKIIDGV